MWNRYILPHLINCACSAKPFRIQRGKIIPQARGQVLEIGFGTGLNLPHYRDSQVETLYALEPAEAVYALAQPERYNLDIQPIHALAEDIPLPSQSIDTIVCTYTLCTIEDAASALKEMHRLLKPAGQLLFSEHGLAPDTSVAKWQGRINPLWKRLAGGCNLTRNAPELLREAGFELRELEQRYLPGSKLMMYHSWGSCEVH